MAPFTWDGLPVEIQFIILETLAEVEYNQGTSLVGYATVSRTWQPVFEKFTFRNVSVRASGLDDFGTTFGDVRRRRHVRYIGLVLELAQYEEVCTYSAQDLADESCGPFFRSREDLAMAQLLTIAQGGADIVRSLPHVQNEQTRNNALVAKALVAFVGHLGRWTRAEACREGLAVEIIASSQSYWQKMAAHLRQRDGPPVLQLADDNLNLKSFPIPPYMWERCLRAAELNFHFALGLDFGEAPGSAPPVALPTAPAVTRVSVLGRTNRSFEPGALATILRCFPSAADLDLELWPRARRSVKHAFDSRLVDTVASWPPSLRRVRIHQMEDPDYPGVPRNNPHIGALGHKLARLCERLEHLSVSYRIDALNFFSASVPQWASLERLTLRSRHMIVDDYPSTLNLLLRAAARAALRMPKIKCLTIYCLDGLRGGLFTFEVLERSADIDIKCSWPFELDEECMEVWESVARKHDKDRVEWHISEPPLEVVKVCISWALLGDTTPGIHKFIAGLPSSDAA